MAYRQRRRSPRSYGRRAAPARRSRRSSYAGRRTGRRSAGRRSAGRTNHVVIHIEHATNPLRDAATPLGKIQVGPAKGAFA